MLRKLSLESTIYTPDINHLLMIAYKAIHPVSKEKEQCRFMLFVRLRPGIPSHFRNQERTGYYPGNKYTDREPEMLRNLLRMLNNHLPKYDRVELYDNIKNGEERIILKITDDCINRNDVHLYSLMLSNYILPQWLKQ